MAHADAALTPKHRLRLARLIVVGAIAVTALGAGFWRSFNVRVALAGGLALSVAVVLLGLINDILTSAS
jgi:hypothetical protein